MLAVRQEVRSSNSLVCRSACDSVATTATLRPRVETREAGAQAMQTAQHALAAARRSLADAAAFRSTSLVLDSALLLLSNNS